MKQGFIILVVLATVVVLAIAFFAYKLAIENPPHSLQGLTEESSQGSREVYSNEEYSFRFQYPKGWLTKEVEGENSLEVYLNPKIIANALQLQSEKSVIQLKVRQSTNSLEQIISSFCNANNCASIKNSEDITLGKVEAKRFRPPSEITTDVVIFKKDDLVFSFTVDQDKSSEVVYGISVDEKYSAFEQIIKSFEFLI